MRSPTLLLIIVVTIVLAGCTEQKSQLQLQRFSGFAQGTTYNITYWSNVKNDPQTLKNQVDDKFSQLDKLLSNYRSDSTIEHFNHSESIEPIFVGGDITYLVKQAKQISKLSQGCYDLTIKPLFDLWGFNNNKLAIPSDIQLQQIRANIGFHQIKINSLTKMQKKKPQLKVDLSSIAQGYSVGSIAQLLEHQGIHNYLVEIGGELQTRGMKPDNTPWRVAVERPVPGERSVHKTFTIKQIKPISVMTSGTYRHFFDDSGNKYSHIIDARTGRPVKHKTVSVTVLHDDPTLADAWSTALLCLGSQQGLAVAKDANVAALFIDEKTVGLEEFSSKAFEQLNKIEVQ